jgi:RNA polymerase sigma-70 factor (ECF subfamily)
VTTPRDQAGADDGTLVRRCQAGDLAAFEPLVEKYRQRVWRLAYEILRDREEAWDCVQEAFVRAYQSLASFRGQSAFYTWLFRITVNVATDRYRARGARARAFGAEPVPEEEWERTLVDGEAAPDREAIRAQQRHRIRQALDALPPKSRTIIMLSDVEGLSYREMADVLNCPIGTVMSRLHNARQRLRALLGPLLALLVWATAALLPGPASAQSEAVVRFGVRVLQASNAAPAPAGVLPDKGLAPSSPSSLASVDIEADPRIRRVIPQLRTLFRYTEYTQLERHRAEVTMGTLQRIPVVGDRQLEITPDRFEGNLVRFGVRLLRGDQQELRAVLVAPPGSPAVLGGPPHGGGVLIIILWVHPAAKPGDR